MELTITDLGGSCPVQGTGTFGQYPFYFRARYDYWTCSITLNIGDDPVDVLLDDAPGYTYRQSYGNQGGFDAGYMELEKAEEFIKWCFTEFCQNTLVQLLNEDAAARIHNE